MNEEEVTRLQSILEEHFQAFTLAAFDMDGNALELGFCTTDIQSCALADMMRSVAIRRTEAPAVSVREDG